MEHSARLRHPAPAGLPRFLSTPRGFLLLICCYFVLHAGLRLLTSNTVDRDEAEQLVMSQQLTWGYGSQPPLYTWLLLPLIKLFGPNVLPLILLKSVLLFGIYAFTYFNARFILRDHGLAVLAALSLLFVPGISWESQRDLTHSVLVTFCTVVTFHLFLRLCEKRRLTDYALFGCVAAAGFLSKYSFAIFLIALLIAAALSRALRPVVLNRGMLLAAVVGIVLVTPASLWAIQHRDLVQVAALKLTLGGTDLSWFAAVAKGLGKFVGAVFVHTGALLLLYLLTLRNRETANRFLKDERILLIWRSLLIICIILVSMILTAGASRFAERWLMPFCIWLPIIAVAMASDRLDALRRKIFLIAATCVALTVCVAVPARIWFAERFKWPQSLNAPLDALSAELRERDPNPRLIFTDSSWLGGNLRQHFPNSRIICPTVPVLQPPPPGESCLLIWNATTNAAADERFTRLANRFTDADLAPEKSHQVEETMKYFTTRQMRLGFTTGIVKQNSDSKDKISAIQKSSSPLAPRAESAHPQVQHTSAD